MSPLEPCPQCGAFPSGPARSTCEYCGARLTSEPAPGERARSDRAARLEAVERHPDYAAAMAHAPDLRGHMVGAFLGLGCFGAFSVVTGLITLGGLGLTTFGFSEFGPGGAAGIPFVIVPALMSAGSGFVVFQMMRRTKQFQSGELERRPAIVRDERSRSREKSTSYFATLEFRDGHREEFQVSAKIASAVVRDDAGVAYLKGGFLVDFRRIDV